MKERTRSSVAGWLGVLISGLILVGCGSSAEPAIPTRPPAPTFTPTAEIQAPGGVDPAVAAAAATAQAEALATQSAAAAQPAATQPPAQEAAPTEAPTAAPTPTVAQAAEAIASSQINVRGGPGTNYNIVGAANAGQHFPITGKNNDGTWWQIDFNGQKGWVFGELVTTQNVQQVAIAPDIPAPPPTPIPQPTPVPQPTQPPAAQPQPTQPPAAPSNNFPFEVGKTESCAPNKGNAYFNGFVRDSSNNLMNGVCVHLDMYGPRGTKCSGCDGVGNGIWGFSPFGGPSKGGETISIFVVQCPGPMPLGGQTQQSGFGDLTPQSPAWTHTMNGSEQCTGITFYKK